MHRKIGCAFMAVLGILLSFPTWAAKQGTLVISSEPTGATIYIDGVNEGETGQKPVAIEVEAGVRTVELRMNGYQTRTEKIRVRPNQKRILRWQLALSLIHI